MNGFHQFNKTLYSYCSSPITARTTHIFFLVINLILISSCGGGAGGGSSAPNDISNNSLQPQSISFTVNDQVDLEVGSSFANPASGEGTGVVSYVSSDPSVVVVQPDGTVNAIAEGAAEITAEITADDTYSSASSSYVVQVMLRDQHILFSEPDTISLAVGDKFTNIATFAGVGALTYDSSNSTVATIDNSGEVNAIAQGETVITVTVASDFTYKEASSSYKVVVDLNAQDLSFNDQSSASLLAGTTYDNPAAGLGSGAILYTSSNPLVAEVDGNGVVTAHTAGNTVISAVISSDGTYSTGTASYELEVLMNSQVLSFSQVVPVAIPVAESYVNVASGLGVGVISYSSDNPLIATVSPDGVVLGVGAGTAIITAVIAEDGFYDTAQASYQIEIVLREQTLSFEEPELVSIQTGDVYQNAAIADGTGVISYESSDTNVVTVDANGSITALTAGIAEITASIGPDQVYAEASNSYIVEVNLSSQILSFVNAGDVSLFTNQNLSNTAIGEGSGLIAYESSDSAVATVDQAGVVDALAPGTAVITAAIEADDFYDAAVESYQVSVINGSFSLAAWIGKNDTEIILPDGLEGMNLISSSDADCDPSNYAVCNDGELTHIENGINASITAATLDKTGHLIFTHGENTLKTTVGLDSFGERAGHQVISFKGEFWLVGGLSGRSRKSDVWSSDNGVTWTLRNSTAAFSPRSGHRVIVFNDELFLIGGTDSSGLKNDVWSSSDGVNWIERTPASGFNPRADFGLAEFDGNLWIFGGDGPGVDDYENDVWSSIDGVNWSLRNDSAAFSPRAGHSILVYDERLWLMGGADSVFHNDDIWVSDDGLNWTEVLAEAPFGERKYHVTINYNNKIWLIGGGRFSTQYTDIWSSSDGVSWEVVNPAAEFPARTGPRIAEFKNKLWVIGSAETEGEVWSSEDGVSWLEQTLLTSFEARGGHEVVEFNDRLWMIAGETGFVEWANDVLMSADGINWQKVTPSAEFSDRKLHQAVAFKGKLWVIAGSSQKNDIWSSTDGVTWFQETSFAEFLGRDQHQVVVFDDQLWVIGGCCDLGKFRNDVWSSTDGVNWVERSDGVIPRAAGHQAVVFNNEIWIIGGYDIDAFYTSVWASPDGINWSLRTAFLPFGNRNSHRVAVFQNKLWLIGGFDRFNLKNDVWSSVDGVSWVREVEDADFSSRQLHELVVYKDRLWLFGGSDLDGVEKNDIWSTVDGINWRRAYRNNTLMFPGK